MNAGIPLGTLLAALLVVGAYQWKPTYSVVFGGPTDGPLVRGFNAGEQAGGSGGAPFRWSTGDSYITLRDVGRQDYDVTLQIGPRPAGEPPASVTVDVGGTTVLSATSPQQAPADFSFSVPREAVSDGTLLLHLKSSTFNPPGDTRELGVMLTRLDVKPSAHPDRFVEPPPGPLLAVAGAALLLAVWLAVLGWGLGGVIALSGSVGLLAAVLLVGDRLWLTSGRWYNSWPLSLLAGAVIMGAGGLVLKWALRRSGYPLPALAGKLLLTFGLVVFAVRLAGQMHPQILIVDLIFHAHRFSTVESGQLLFTIQSAEWGGRETFYLPTAYIFMLPLQWLFNDQLYVIKLFMVSLSTLASLLIFYIARTSLNSGRAGVFASALYLTVPIAVLPFSWGIMSNLFGEFFLLLSLAVALASYSTLSPMRPAFWLLLFALLMSLLSHPGVLQLSGVAFSLVGVLWLVRGRAIGSRRGALWTLGALGIASLTAYVFYYGHFAEMMLNTFRELQAERARSANGAFHVKIGGSVADRSLGLIVRYASSRSEWFFGGLRGFWQEAQAYYRVWPIPAAFLGFAAVSTAVRGAPKDVAARHRVLVTAATGWALTGLLFLVVGWVVNLYVRYALFVLPVSALGAGYLLALLWKRGRAGSLLGALMLLFYAVEALALWQARITYAFK